MNVNVTYNGVPINQRANRVNKDRDGTHELLEDCGNSSKSSEDDWESASTILSILVTNPHKFELNKKPSGIRDNQVFTLDRSKVSVDSVKADDNGSYISKGNPRKSYHWDLENAPHLAHLNKDNNRWTIKERDADGCTYVDTLVSNKEVYEIKRSYRQNKNNPWVTQTIIQVKRVTSDEYLSHYLVFYKTTVKTDANTQFLMPRHGNATSPDAPLYFRQDPLIKENINKGVDLGHSNKKIYVDLARREGTSLSETIRDTRVVSNRRNNSKVKQATRSEVKYSETECIVRYLKTNDSFVKTFSLDR